MLRLNRRHVYRDNVAPSSGMKAIDIRALEGATPYINARIMAPNVYFGFLQYENFAAFIIIGTEIIIQ